MLILLLLIIIAVVIYLLLWPIPIKPISWQASEPPPAEGDFALNDRLAAAQRLAVGGVGPEDVIFDRDGWLYAGLLDGRIMRMRSDGSQRQQLANTGGRPLGLAINLDGSLLVADADEGLLSISTQGEITVLVDKVNGRKLKFTNHLDVAADGTIYFSESSDRFPLHNYIADILEGRANGRLFAYDPHSGETRLILDGLYFANGIAILPDQSALFICETSRYRLRKVWLSGPKAGTDEIFIENLPGFPDNLHFNGRDIFWLSFSSTRKLIIDKLADKPLIRKIIYRIPDALKPKPERHGYVLGFDAEGNIIHNFQDPSGIFAQTSGAVEYDGAVYVGSLSEDFVARLQI